MVFEFLNILSLNPSAGPLGSLALFTLGITIYAIFIFKFYRFVARKNVFDLEFIKYAKGWDILKNTYHLIIYLLQYVIVFPIIIVIWSTIFAILLAFLSKGNTASTVLLLSMSIVSSIRITSYYNEDLSKDLAKMIPFALLGVFIIDLNFFSFGESFDVLQGMVGEFVTVLYYLVFTIFLEFSLRILSKVFRFKDTNVQDD